MKAVITGDIIQSTRLSAAQRSELVKRLQHALKQWQDDFAFKSEFFQGDSFQCILQPQLSLRVALLIKTFIKSLNPSFSIGRKQKILPGTSQYSIDARIAIGIGEVESRAKLATSNGEAFILSGHLLEQLKSSKQTFAVATKDAFAAELETESVLLDALIAKTTAMQCEVINLKLLYYNELQIAKHLNIIQSAVNQRSRSGNWNAINAMVNRFEKIYHN